MLRLYFVLLWYGCITMLVAQNPHGPNLKINCAACHTSAGWEISSQYWQDLDPEKPRISRMTGNVWGPDTMRFHHGKTRFELTGQHAKVDCRACHGSLVFEKTGSDCLSCHTDIHQQTAGTDCARCHTTQNWLINDIQQLHADNGFPLVGSHKVADCAACHQSASNLQFDRVGNQCIDCHLADFNATLSPNHQASGFSTNCQDCHDPFKPGWNSDKINHDFFPLTKGHDIADCSRCHTNGFAGTSNQCASCHTTDFNVSQNPSHVALGLPMDCAMCHTTDPDWTPAAFPIHNQFHPLLGAHAQIANNCDACHHGNYTNTPNTCIGCHTADYNATSNPNHINLQFSTDCTTCHSETAWAPASFDHDAQFFPIYSGKHKDQWNACSDCHTNPANYSEFTCTNCHTNPQTNNQHNGIGGYIYNSQACLACHPNGDATGGFDHNQTDFPLTGAHMGADCVQCHSNGYAGTPTQCIACHTSDYNAANDPRHASAGFPTTCQDCHTTSAWQPSNFNHDQEYFPIYSGKHNGEWNQCIECHTIAGNFAEFSCITCHEHNNATKMANKHQGVSGYQYLSTACLECHPKGN
ncbi:MAG: hypothetical protein JNN28_09180 [Saprospiraceae bacterium]|nr:hypothetical protein [Saprospiraceae bacterium]